MGKIMEEKIMEEIIRKEIKKLNKKLIKNNLLSIFLINGTKKTFIPYKILRCKEHCNKLFDKCEFCSKRFTSIYNYNDYHICMECHMNIDW